MKEGIVLHGVISENLDGDLTLTVDTDYDECTQRITGAQPLKALSLPWLNAQIRARLRSSAQTSGQG